MRPLHIALAALVAAVWGVNFVVIEVGLGHFPPLLFSALRFLVAALPAVFLVGRPKVAWKWIVGVGLVLGVAKFGLLFIGMDRGMPAASRPSCSRSRRSSRPSSPPSPSVNAPER